MVQLGPSGFQLEERALVPDGVNSYPLLQLVGENKWDAVRDVLAQALALGRPFVRTNAFMDGGDNPARLRDDDGTIREEGLRALDALLAEADRMNVRLLLVLGNNWPDGGGAEAVVEAVAPGEDLPKDAFWSEPRAVAAQRAMIAAIVGRTNTVTKLAYAEDATVFAWELANEPFCTEDEWCDAETLPRWAEKMGDAVRAAGARQPVAWGGAGYRGQYGEDLEAIARTGAVDVLTLHVYARRLPAADTRARDALIEDAIESATLVLRDRADLADRFGMPLLVEELGYEPPRSAQGRDAERAHVLRALLRVTAELRLPTFPWMIAESDRADDDGFLIRPSDTATVLALTCGAAADG
jgi:mannan endo-1,4-beta-mannosidase